MQKFTFLLKNAKSSPSVYSFKVTFPECLVITYIYSKCIRDKISFPEDCRKVISIRHSFLGSKTTCLSSNDLIALVAIKKENYGCYKQENCGMRCFVLISFSSVSLDVMIYHADYIPNEYTQRREEGTLL